MALGKDYVTQECSIARALEVVGERWTLLVVRDAIYGVRRYNDFLVHLGIPRAVLSARLRTLTEEGVLEKRRYQETPPRDEYVVTERGAALWPALRALGQWGREYVDGNRLRSFRHADCGGGRRAVRNVRRLRNSRAGRGRCHGAGPGTGLRARGSGQQGAAAAEAKRLLEPLETDPVHLAH
ncbi:helix-turn-helix domain-containing protein [Streptomyces echinatus]